MVSKIYSLFFSGCLLAKEMATIASKQNTLYSVKDTQALCRPQQLLGFRWPHILLYMS